MIQAWLDNDVNTGLAVVRQQQSRWLEYRVCTLFQDCAGPVLEACRHLHAVLHVIRVIRSIQLATEQTIKFGNFSHITRNNTNRVAQCRLMKAGCISDDSVGPAQHLNAVRKLAFTWIDCDDIHIGIHVSDLFDYVIF